MNVIVVNENSKIMDQLDVDVIKKINGQFEVSELLSKFVNLYFEKLIIDVTSIKNYTDLGTISSFAKSVDASRVILLLNDVPEVNANSYLANLVHNGLYNFSRNVEGIKFLYGNPNTFENVKYLLEPTPQMQNTVDTSMMSQSVNAGVGVVGMTTAAAPQMSGGFASSRRIIGLSNMTMHAGASTLTNMMVRQLNAHDIPAKGIEMSRQDLLYYRSDNLVSCMTRIDLERTLRENSGVPAIIIDLNEFPEADKFCDTILYLVEPSFIRLTKCIRRNKNAFVEKKDEKIVLNMSFVSEDEVYDFEIETGVKVFENIPPLNDRDEDSSDINRLLSKLGFNV